MKNTENKYWYAEKNSDAYTHILTVDVYNRWDDEHIATIDLMYHYNPINDNESWTVETAEWSKELTIAEAEDVIAELTHGASDHFHEFAYQCYHFNPHEEGTWFV